MVGISVTVTTEVTFVAQFQAAIFTKVRGGLERYWKRGDLGFFRTGTVIYLEFIRPPLRINRQTKCPCLLTVNL